MVARQVKERHIEPLDEGIKLLPLAFQLLNIPVPRSPLDQVTHRDHELRSQFVQLINRSRKNSFPGTAGTVGDDGELKILWLVEKLLFGPGFLVGLNGMRESGNFFGSPKWKMEEKQANRKKNKLCIHKHGKLSWIFLSFASSIQERFGTPCIGFANGPWIQTVASLSINYPIPPSVRNFAEFRFPISRVFSDRPRDHYANFDNNQFPASRR